VDLREIVCENVDLIYLAYDGVQWCVPVKKAMNLQGNFLTGLATIRFSRSTLLHGVN
jgi:hypothetical protein